MIGKATNTLMINGTYTVDNNDNILMIRIIVIHIMELSTKFILAQSSAIVHIYKFKKFSILYECKKRPKENMILKRLRITFLHFCIFQYMIL